MTHDLHLSHSHSRRMVLVLGGARSDKSGYAEALATRVAGGRPVLYVATATAGDDAEMRTRIATHQRGRPPEWTTIEAPLDPGTAIQAHGGPGASSVPARWINRDRVRARPGSAALTRCRQAWSLWHWFRANYRRPTGFPSASCSGASAEPAAGRHTR